VIGKLFSIVLPLLTGGSLVVSMIKLTSLWISGAECGVGLRVKKVKKCGEVMPTEDIIPLEGSQNGACWEGGVARILQLQPCVLKMAGTPRSQPSGRSVWLRSRRVQRGVPGESPAAET